MSNIIEKLGIKTPDEIKIVLDVYAVYDLAGLKRPSISTLNFDEAKKLKKILDDKNEMLEALIELGRIFEIMEYANFELLLAPIIKIVKKACCPKTWQEIKELSCNS